MGRTRSVSWICRLPSCRSAFASVRPLKPSAGDGDARSGGSVAWTRLRNRARERTLRSNARNASASLGRCVRSSVAVRAGSRHNVIGRPSADGAKATTSGSTARRPYPLSRRSRTTLARRPPMPSATTGARTPGATSSIASVPPARLRRSSTSVRRPAFARYPAVTRPLWPAPTMIASYRSRATSIQAALRFRSERTTWRAARRPDAPMIPPPGCVAEPHIQRFCNGVR